MKKLNLLYLIIFVIVLRANDTMAQTGYYDAPYTRYEADKGTLANASVTGKSYKQSDLQSEASEQVCVNMSSSGASVSWTVSTDGDGLVVRYSVPDGQSGVLEVFANNVSQGTLTLTSNYSWEYLSTNGNPNNSGVVNTNPKMRFDEVRMKLASKIPAGGTLKLVRNSGNIHLDFAELELVPAAVAWSTGNVTYAGDGSTLQSYINNNGGKTIYLPAGVYNVSSELYFGVANTTLKGAGMWYTQINFTETNTCNGGSGGLNANANNISYSGLYLTTVRNSRSCTYKGINGVYTSGSTITNIWAEHFECGAWIAQYNSGGPSKADGFTMSNCRFRNNYADGINLCKGTSNAIVEHCSFRNNGDDDMAIWSQSDMECQNNTYRYNTSENCWRASGCAIYGGYNNQAHHLLIKDNLEVGLRVGNNFPGAPFNTGGQHTFSDITIIRCGTFNDLFNSPVGAIDILCDNVAGTRINNVKFSNITITDSKNDAIYIYKKAGEGFYNLTFENITINGTGKEYPDNNIDNLNWGRGYMILFAGSPSGNGTYCNMAYSGRGGNASVNVNTGQIGTFSWTASSGCTPVPVITSSTTASGTSGTSFSYSITASNSPTSYNATGLPAGLSINTSTGAITGIPTTAGVYTVTISASNNGGEGTTTLTLTIGCSAVTIPNTIQAEAYCDMSGIQLETTTDNGGGQNVGYFDTGDWMSYKINVPIAGSYPVLYRVASGAANASLLTMESMGGATTYGTITVPVTGDWQTWATVQDTVQLPAGDQTIALSTTTGGFNINWITFGDIIITTGTSEIKKSLFKMYPNPVNDILTVNSSNALRDITIYDATGRLVYSQQNLGKNFSVDFQNFSPGFYTVVVTDGDFNIQTSSLIK